MSFGFLVFLAEIFTTTFFQKVLRLLRTCSVNDKRSKHILFVYCRHNTRPLAPQRVFVRPVALLYGRFRSPLEQIKGRYTGTQACFLTGYTD